MAAEPASQGWPRPAARPAALGPGEPPAGHGGGRDRVGRARRLARGCGVRGPAHALARVLEAHRLARWADRLRRGCGGTSGGSRTRLDLGLRLLPLPAVHDHLRGLRRAAAGVSRDRPLPLAARARPSRRDRRPRPRARPLGPGRIARRRPGAARAAPHPRRPHACERAGSLRGAAGGGPDRARGRGDGTAVHLREPVPLPRRRDARSQPRTRCRSSIRRRSTTSCSIARSERSSSRSSSSSSCSRSSSAGSAGCRSSRSPPASRCGASTRSSPAAARPSRPLPPRRSTAGRTSVPSEASNARAGRP